MSSTAGISTPASAMRIISAVMSASALASADDRSSASSSTRSAIALAYTDWNRWGRSADADSLALWLANDALDRAERIVT